MHGHDAGKTRLKKLVSSAKSAKPMLPLVHSTDAYLFDQAMTGGALEPNYCDVFVGEMLLYTFYGRPSFRPNMNELATSMGHYLPVCLIFKQGFSSEIRRVFPFDTGAFTRDFYRAYLHDKMQLADFALEADMETPGRVVSTFFGSAKDYLFADPHRAVDIDPSQFEAQSYAALIDAKGSNAMDSRGSGIEVQLAESISIATWVEAAIVPSSFVGGEMGCALQKLGIHVIPYQVHGQTRPTEYTSAITDYCIRYYTEKGLLPELRK